MDTLIRIELKEARVIEAVARARGIDNAAQLLHMTQPSVSRVIATAEKSLRVRLFQRGWGGTEPTAWCETILPRCSAAVHLMEEAEIAIEAISGVRPNLRNFLRWNHLDAVAMVATRGSALAASAALGVSQPAISRSIASISDYTKTPLFKRLQHGLQPTHAAELLSQLRDSMMRELASTDGFGLGGGRILSGRLAVGILPFSGQSLVAESLGHLTVSHPELRLMAVPGTYAMLVAALLRGEIDCVMGTMRRPPPSGLHEIYLYSEKFTLIAHRCHPCHAYARTMSDLAHESWMVAPHGAPVRAYFEQLFRDLGSTPPAQTCEILSFKDAEQVILNSRSIGMLSYADKHLESLPADLKKLEVILPDPIVPIGLTIREGEDSLPVMSKFISVLRERITAFV